MSRKPVQQDSNGRHRLPKQLDGLVEISKDPTDDAHGTYYGERSIEQLLRYGLIILDKPPGPTSHEAVAWAKRILNIPKIGHSGTLDPQVSGVLPLGLGEATKALGVLLLGPKEYHALGRIHSLAKSEEIDRVMGMLQGQIYQKPPQRSAVLRQTRTRTIYEFELLEQRERLLLTRILCEAGTYIRKLYYDMGEILGPGATMIELRRTRVSQFYEADGLVTMHELADAYARWTEEGDGTMLHSMIRPVEDALSEIKSVVIGDAAVDAMCHGAQLAIPGILKVHPNLKKGEIAAIYTQKGEAVALAEAGMSADEISEAAKGHAFETKRIIMAPGTYPKRWRTRPKRGGDGGSSSSSSSSSSGSATTGDAARQHAG
ncbi:MAG: RNA-guided pseudouridylation complex pseudouridine synthase subunit Cbf5 [Thaumarchaeota archaeon]|nr:RNA-guided pseudouridylation complex pseudouridine synthase subunit Cbf5 [Nitrososphaerota archaeon]